MPGKYTDGFTKSANKSKFVRNRDIKLKDKEEKKEEHIQKLMCEGVCDHCREKVQWKFHYSKYKPLKNPGTCQNCKNKTVTKAYRTYCDRCAAAKKCCASCLTTEFQNSHSRAAARAAEAAAAEAAEGGEGGGGAAAPASKPVRTFKATKKTHDDDDDDDDDFDDDDEEEDDDDEDDDEDSEDDDEDEEEEEEEEEGEEEVEAVAGGESSELTASTARFNEMHTVFTSAIAGASNLGSRWDEKKFVSKAAGKYSKSRVVGQEAVDVAVAAMAEDVGAVGTLSAAEAATAEAGSSSSSSSSTDAGAEA